MPGILPLTEYSPLISLTTPFKAPPAPSGDDAAEALDSALSYLWRENRHLATCGSHGHTHEYHGNDRVDAVLSLEVHQKTKALRQLLTVREPITPLPEAVGADIDTALAYINGKKALTAVSSIPSIQQLVPDANPLLKKVSLWRGDITSLSGVTAIMNAANERMLGCFTAGHICIDNVIHFAAGPRLREDCKKIMDAQGCPEPNGTVKVTRGYLLPAKYVLHTVGPEIPKRSPARIMDWEQTDLEGCYKSCLETVEGLEVSEGEEKTVAFCCVSTGVFGYPADQAVHVAVDTVLSYLTANPETTIDRVIFNVFTASDFTIYIDKLNSVLNTPSLTPLLLTVRPTSSPVLDSVALVAQWLKKSPNILITGGAGLSASDGLDYTSHDLFRTHFPGMWKRGFTCFYNFIGYDGWNSRSAKWGYFFSHIPFVREWVPPCGVENSVYTKLHKILTHFYPEGDMTRGEYFIRTSNADGLFFRNGFDPDRIATPQGTYNLLQCLAKCRPDAYWPVQPFIDAALPYLDKEECIIREDIDGWEKAIPICKYCGADMFMCVRGGDYFIETPFAATNKGYREFLRRTVTGPGKGDAEEEVKLVILELGAGFNTPGVIRWENERLVNLGGGAVKLVRVGLGGSEGVEWVLEGEGKAVGIEGDAGVIIGNLLEGLGIA